MTPNITIRQTHKTTYEDWNPPIDFYWFVYSRKAESIIQATNESSNQISDFCFLFLLKEYNRSTDVAWVSWELPMNSFVHHSISERSTGQSVWTQSWFDQHLHAIRARCGGLWGEGRLPPAVRGAHSRPFSQICWPYSLHLFHTWWLFSLKFISKMVGFTVHTQHIFSLRELAYHVCVKHTIFMQIIKDLLDCLCYKFSFIPTWNPVHVFPVFTVYCSNGS